MKFPKININKINIEKFKELNKKTKLIYLAATLVVTSLAYFITKNNDKSIDFPDDISIVDVIDMNKESSNLDEILVNPYFVEKFGNFYELLNTYETNLTNYVISNRRETVEELYNGRVVSNECIESLGNLIECLIKAQLTSALGIKPENIVSIDYYPDRNSGRYDVKYYENSVKNNNLTTPIKYQQIVEKSIKAKNMDKISELYGKYSTGTAASNENKIVEDFEEVMNFAIKKGKVEKNSVKYEQNNTEIKNELKEYKKIKKPTK